MKRMKKGLSLLLVLCMLLSMLPAGALAADRGAAETNAASSTDSYRIVQVDAGRKYWSVAVLKELIDEMAKNNYNQLGFYFSDNQGFRLALSDMSFTVDGKTYDLSAALGNGIMQTGNSAPGKTENLNEAHFKPSHEDKWLNETEMKEVISYARSRGIEVVPSFDMPGHMGAILNAPDFQGFKYAGYGTTTNSSFDVTNPTAQKVMLAVLERYVKFFAANGCKYFNICSDEFCYDIGRSTADSISNPTLCKAVVTFMDEAAKLIVKAGMTPRAFSDYLYALDDYAYSDAYKKFEILFWDKATNLTKCQEMGNKLINVDERCYYALNTKYYTSPDVGVKAFQPNHISTNAGGTGFDLPNPAGAMFCIWCDGGYLDSEPAEGDAGASVLNQVMNFKSQGQSEATNLLEAFAKQVNTYYNVDTSIYYLYVGDAFTVRVSGDFASAEDAMKLVTKNGDTSAASVQVANFKAGTPGGELSPVETPTDGAVVVVTDGTNYLVINADETIGNTTDPAQATRFTVAVSGANFDLQLNGKKLTGSTNDSPTEVVLRSSSTPFKYDNGTLKEAWWPDRYFAYENGWKLSKSAPEASVKIYASSPAVAATADLLFTGITPGTAEYVVDGVKYTFVVSEKGTEPDPTAPTEPEPTDPTTPPVTEPTDPTTPTDPEPTDPTAPPVTEPEKPTEPMPTYPEEAETDVYIRVPVNGTKDFRMENQDLSTADKDVTNWKPGYAEYQVAYTPYYPGGEPVAMPDPQDGAEVVVTDGTHYLVLNEDKTIGSTTELADATRWKLTINNVQSKNFFLSSNGLYLNGKQGGVVADEAQGVAWVYVDGALKQAWYGDAAAAYLVFDATAGWTLSADAPTNSVVVNGLTPARNAFSTITFTGTKEGDAGSVKIGETTYHVVVVPETLKDAPALTAYCFITNNKAYGAVSGEHTVKLDAASAYGEQGVPFNRLVEKNATWKLSENPLAFWKSVCLPYGKWQTAIQEDIDGKGSSIDKTLEGNGFTYIRYYNDRWAWSNTPENPDSWTEIKTAENTEDQIVAYYLQVTPVTKEITTQVADWGYTQYDNNFNGTGDLAGGYVLLDYAVRYPDLHRNPNLFTRDLTISYHTLANDVQVKGDGTADGLNRTRRIGISRAVNSSEYEVYLVTVTPSSNDPNVKLTDAAGNAAAMPEDVQKESDQLYAGTEYVAWALTEQDYLDSGLPKVKGIGTASTADKTYDQTLGIANYHEGGDCTVDEVWIVRNQAMRITYYIRDKNIETAPLQVHYYDITDGKAETPFFQFGIYTEKEEFFTSRVNDSKDPIFGTTNKYGVTQEVHKDLKQTGCPAYYRTANYEYVEYDISEDGKTLNLYYKRRAGEVYVVDFGLPLQVTMGKILEGAKSISTIDDIASIQISGTMRYGTLSTDFSEAKAVTSEDVVFTYTPTQVMDGKETIHITLNFKEEDAKPLTSTMTILPATTMYYEQGFASYTGAWTDGHGFKGGEISQQAALAGDTQKAENPAYNYGYDGVYETQRDALNSYAGTTAVGASAAFTFTGTGVDLYADCTNNSGSVMMLLTKGGQMERLIVVDTRNKGGQTGATEFETKLTETFNIPIISLRNLEFGTHEVKLIFCESFDGESKVETRADGFRFDGFRVYNPMGTDAFAQTQYALDKEADPSYTELRDAEILALNLSKELLEGSSYAEDLAKDIMSQVNASYPDGISVSAVVTRQSDSSDAISVDLLDNGPKNEIYLRQNESIAIVDRNKDSRAQLGMKALSGAVTYQMGSESKTLAANVDMFYPMAWTTADSGSSATVTNTGANPMAVTILKQFSADATAKVTEELIAQVLMQMGVPSAHESDAWENPFTDVHEDAWFYGAVRYVYENGLFKGTTPTTFEPGSNMTRGMLAVVLYRLAGEPETDAANPFTDVKDDAYFAKAVAWAAEQGIVLGRGDGTFAPGEDVTRQDMVVMLYRYAVCVDKTGAAGVETLDFTDADEVLAYAKQAVAWAVANGILKGYDLGGTFALLPGKTINRAEVAAIMERVAPILR